MCLAIPGEVLEIDGMVARAEFWDVEKTVRLDIVGESVEEGDYILNHAGFAIRRIPDDEVEETIEIYESFLEGDEDEALEEIGAEGRSLGIEGSDEDGGAPTRPGPMGKPDPELDPMADTEESDGD
jgi:hydrogenase expression/formation protein HypC